VVGIGLAHHGGESQVCEWRVVLGLVLRRGAALRQPSLDGATPDGGHHAGKALERRGSGPCGGSGSPT
jgi:hypothetical protein